MVGWLASVAQIKSNARIKARVFYIRLRNIFRLAAGVASGFRLHCHDLACSGK